MIRLARFAPPASAAVGLLILYAIYRVGRAIDQAWDDDGDYMLVSCNGHDPVAWEEP